MSRGRMERVNQPHRSLAEEPVYMPASTGEWGELTDGLLSLAWEFADQREPGCRAEHEERQRIYGELWSELSEEQRQQWDAGDGRATPEMKEVWVAAWNDKIRQRNKQAAAMF